MNRKTTGQKAPKPMNDTELLKNLLGHMTVTESGDLDWPYSDMVKGLRDSGESSDIVEALVKRRSEFYGEVNYS